MKVILLQDIENLGKKDDVKEVADGYARNFLLPRSLAEPATDSVLAKLEFRKKEAAQKAEEELAQYQQIVSAIDGIEIEIPAKISEEKKLYGAITATQIVKILKEKGFNVAKQQIKMDDAIKELGEYDVVLEFAHGLEAKIKIIVVEEK